MRPHWPASRFALRFLLPLFLVTGGTLRGVEINVDLVPSGPVAVGEIVTVHLSVSGWDATDGEVDAVSFFVDFDPAHFEYVTASGTLLKDGSEFLAQPKQGAAYAPADDSDDSLTAFGRYIFGVSDVGDATAGSLGPDGGLGSFQLRAIADGSSNVTADAPSLNDIFGDVDFFGISPTGGVTMQSAPVTVTSAPQEVAITAIGLVDSNTIFLEFLSSEKNTLHQVRSSATLAATPFTGLVRLSGGSLTSDSSGAGRIEIDVNAGGDLFFQMQVPK